MMIKDKNRAKLALDQKEWDRGYSDGLNGITTQGGLSYYSGRIEGKAEREAGSGKACLRSAPSASQSLVKGGLC